MYYEGKEFEASITHARPGALERGGDACTPAVHCDGRGHCCRWQVGVDRRCAFPVCCCSPGAPAWRALLAASLERLDPPPRPAGVLSAELQNALGMGESAPPPWLINMQAGGSRGGACACRRFPAVVHECRWLVQKAAGRRGVQASTALPSAVASAHSRTRPCSSALQRHAPPPSSQCPALTSCPLVHSSPPILAFLVLTPAQRYGPPPSYPALKVPGLNAPIPPGGMFGYHPGELGK